LFVPVKNASRKRKKEDIQKEMLEMMKKAFEKDPMKDYIQFAREEAERSRQHEDRMMEMICSQIPSSVYQQIQSPLSYGVQFQTNIPPPGNKNDYSLFKL
jgi:epoxyqueuosine reductase QueG